MLFIKDQSSGNQHVDLPSPDNMRNAPVWDNYIVAQALQASLELIPPNLTAYGVKVDGVNVELHFYMPNITDRDEKTINEIAGNLEESVGKDVVTTVVKGSEKPQSTVPSNGMYWIFLAENKDLLAE